MSDIFWFNDAQWARIATLLPACKSAAPRVGDRRVLSGIVHVPIGGCRWKDAPAACGPRQTLHNRFARRAGKGVWQGIFAAFAEEGGPPLETMPVDSAHVKAHRAAAGGKRGLCVTLWGRAVAGETRRSILSPTQKAARDGLTPGNTHDIKPAMQLLRMARPRRVIADKAYDSAARRRSLGRRGIQTVIPNRRTRLQPFAFDQARYRNRNIVKRCFCRLKDFRRVAKTLIATVCIAAFVAFWLKATP